MDYDAILTTWLVAWDALPESPPLRRVRDLVTSLPPELRFAVMRRLAWDRWSSEGRSYPPPQECRELVEGAVRLHQTDLAGNHVVTAWPLILVYLLHVTRFGYETSRGALDALRGIRSGDLTSALVALVERR